LEMVKGLELDVGINDVQMTYSFGEIIKMVTITDDAESVEAVEGDKDC
jgi:LEA14-like dessication related protein